MLTTKFDRSHNENHHYLNEDDDDSSGFTGENTNTMQLLQTKSLSTDLEFQELRKITKLYENLSLAQKKKFIASFIYT